LAIILYAHSAQAAESDDAIRKSLSTLERVANHIYTQQDALDQANARYALDQHPLQAVPALMEIVADKNRNWGFRDSCLLILDQEKYSRHLLPDNFQQISSIAVDQKEDPQLRIDASDMILRDYKNAPLSIRQAIKQAAFDMSKAKWGAGLVYQRVLAHYAGDPDVENFLLDRLDTDANKNSAILALGKIRSQRALEKIVSLLDSEQAGKSFVKVRAYLAIGDIGGDKAFDYLVHYRKKEKSSLDQDSILTAIGRTKTTRGRDFLLDRLQNNPGTADLVILSAIKFSGDASAIPTLQQELQKPRSAESKRALQNTISALQMGDDSTPW